MGKRVLIVGLTRFAGYRLAQRLEGDPSVEYVAGIDDEPPARALDRTEFIPADVRNPLLGRLVTATEVDTVVDCHVAASLPGHSTATRHELNVIGTMQVLAAAAKSPDVRRVVMLSSTAVYGADPADPAFFTEDMGPRRAPTSVHGRDLAEVEEYCRDFAERTPQIELVVLRSADLLGPTVRTAFTAYLDLPVVPTVLGFNPRLQFAHEDDVIDTLAAAVAAPHGGSEVAGVYNVAGDGVVTLAKLLRMAGRLAVPVAAPLLGPGAAVARRLGVADLPSDLRALLQYGRGVDTQRVRERLHAPRHSTLEAVAALVARQRLRRLEAASDTYRYEQDLQDHILRIQRERAGAPRG